MTPQVFWLLSAVAAAHFLFAPGNLHAQAPAPAAVTQPAGEFARLQAGYKLACDAVSAEREKYLNALDTWYLAGLDKLQEPSQKAGDLEMVLAIKNERTALPGHLSPDEAQLQALPAQLRTLRSTYDVSLSKIVAEIAKRMAAVNQKYVADLEVTQKRLTVSGDIDQALAVRTERERVVAQTPPVAPATPLPVRGMPGLLAQGKELIGATVPKFTKFPIILKGNRIETEAKFQPPIEIAVVANVQATNLRLSYAADEVIFNWEVNQTELRIDGGPAHNLHRPGQGKIPVGRDVVIRWRVTAKKQSIFVDDKLRFEHRGDYSKINRSVGVAAPFETVTVKSLKVLQLPAGTE